MRHQEGVMQVRFVAGFGPIVRDLAASRAFWGDALGLPLAEAAPTYLATDALAGVKAFALWPLDQAAESCFGRAPWSEEIPVPQASWMGMSARTGIRSALDSSHQGARLAPRVDDWGDHGQLGEQTRGAER